MQDEVERRTVLRAGGATLATALAAPLGGCLASGLADVGGGESGPEYATWAPAPGFASDVDHYAVRALRPAALDAHEGDFDSWAYDLLEGGADLALARLDRHFDDLDSLVRLDHAVVLTADVDPEAMATTLADAGYEAAGDHAGYDLFVARRRAAAVADGTLVVGFDAGATPATAVVTAVLDAATGSGDAERYRAASEDFATLVGHLDAGTVVTAATNDPGEAGGWFDREFDGGVARGTRYRVDATETGFRHVVVFADDAAADPDAVERWVGERDGPFGRFDDVTDVSVSRAGRSVLVDGVLDTDDLFR